MRIIILESYAALSKWAACYVAGRINRFKPTKDRPFLLADPGFQGKRGGLGE